MAKFTPGPAVASVSGSVGGTTFSRNRFGQYMRFRAIPTVSTTAEALEAKAILSDRSAGWQGLTDAQRLSWKEYALNNPVSDALGQQQELTGHQSYVGINSRLDQADETLLTAPPVSAPPTGLLTLSATWDIGAGSFALTFTPTPLAATERLWCQAAVVNSQGINYVQNLLKLVSIEAAATATGVDLQTDIEARFGALVVGQKVVVLCSVFDNASGLLSQPRRVEGVVVST